MIHRPPGAPPPVAKNWLVKKFPATQTYSGVVKMIARWSDVRVATATLTLDTAKTRLGENLKLFIDTHFYYIMLEKVS